jgi:hypothetical protein
VFELAKAKKPDPFLDAPIVNKVSVEPEKPKVPLDVDS